MIERKYARQVAQALFSNSPLANFIRVVAALFVLAVVALNASHSFATFSPLGPMSAASLAFLFALAGIVGPVALHATLHAGSFLRGIVCIVTGLACVTLCVATNLGATSAGRGNSAENARKLIEQRDGLRDRKRFIVDDIAKLGSPRAVGVIQSAIDAGGGVDVAVLARSKQCTDVTLPASQKACAPLNALRTELAAAKKLAELQPRLIEVDGQLSKLDVPASIDAQADQLVWIGGVFGLRLDANNVARGTNALTAVLLELIAALTLSLATIIDDAEQRRRKRAADEVRVAPKIIVSDAAGSGYCGSCCSGCAAGRHASRSSTSSARYSAGRSTNSVRSSRALSVARQRRSVARDASRHRGQRGDAGKHAVGGGEAPLRAWCRVPASRLASNSLGCRRCAQWLERAILRCPHSAISVTRTNSCLSP